MGTRMDGNSARATLLHLRKLTGTQHTPFTFSHTTSATLPLALGFMAGQHLTTNSSSANCAGVTLPYIRAPIIVFNSFVNRAKHSPNFSMRCAVGVIKLVLHVPARIPCVIVTNKYSKMP